LFSAIRPPVDASGGLRVLAPRSWIADAVVLVIVVALGLLLLPVSAYGRTLAIGSAISLVAVCGLFDPTLTRTVLNNAMASGVFVVLVSWVVQWLIRQPSPLLTLAASGRTGVVAWWTQINHPPTLKRTTKSPRGAPPSPAPIPPIPGDDTEADEGGMNDE